MGPGAKGEYYEMNCIGMDSVTTKFREPEHHSQRIQKCMWSRVPGCNATKEDWLIKGTRTFTYWDLKCIHLTPVLEQILDSGVAVYISPFKDIYGSNRIFAGPHYSFTNKNDGAKAHAMYMFRKEMIPRMMKNSRSKSPVIC